MRNVFIGQKAYFKFRKKTIPDISYFIDTEPERVSVNSDALKISYEITFLKLNYTFMPYDINFIKP